MSARYPGPLESDRVEARPALPVDITQTSETFLSLLRMQDLNNQLREPNPSGTEGRLPIGPKIDQDHQRATRLVDQSTLTFGVPGHEPWSSVRAGDTQYEQVNKSFASGLLSQSAILGLPILASQLTRNAASSRGLSGGLYQVLNGAIGSYAAHTAIRDARHLYDADGAMGYAKYGLAMAADLGMSAAAFAKMGGVGAKWAAPTMVLSYLARNAIGWIPDRTRPADSL